MKMKRNIFQIQGQGKLPKRDVKLRTHKVKVERIQYTKLKNISRHHKGQHM